MFCEFCTRAHLNMSVPILVVLVVTFLDAAPRRCALLLTLALVASFLGSFENPSLSTPRAIFSEWIAKQIMVASLNAAVQFVLVIHSCRSGVMAIPFESSG